MSPAKTFRNVPDLEGKNPPQPNSKFNLERNAAGDSALCARQGQKMSVWSGGTGEALLAGWMVCTETAPPAYGEGSHRGYRSRLAGRGDDGFQ